ncbi:hypothetical protein VR41_12500 [Streptomyces sp. NRRL B-1568]|nr:hypothetical protein VR41_12500 [Streptomyces sp. NRRL B-1568]
MRPVRIVVIMYTDKQRARARGAGASLVMVLAAITLTTGCGSGGASGTLPAEGPAKQAASPELAEMILDTARLERALPDQFSVPAEVSKSRNRKAWDSGDAAICQSEEWPAQWCSQAVALGIAAYSNAQDQELSVRLISFRTPEQAAALFAGVGTEDEVGKNPPGDQIDGFEVTPGQGWQGRGINVRQGAVIASIKYTWRQGANVPSGRLMSVTRMTVERIKQAQHGETPTASTR